MYHGLLPIWKPKGMTSHDVVFKLRKILSMKKIGHTGTLDPEVEGVLLVCLGKATKLVEFLMEGKKVYRGEITLGYSTETEDSSGAIVNYQKVLEPISNDEIDAAMSNMIGLQNQTPPYYSAVKVKGRKLYEYARQGIEIDRPEKQIEIFDFQRIGLSTYHPENFTQTWEFFVECSKGTYVRTLAVDLGKALGFEAHMSKLTRYATGGFNQSHTVHLDDLPNLVSSGEIYQYIFPIESILGNFQVIELTKHQFEEDIQFGKVLPESYFKVQRFQLLALTYLGELKAIYYPHPDKPDLIKPRKMFI